MNNLKSLSDALSQQTEILGKQREVLAELSVNIEAQKKEIEKQNQNFELQRFENTLFSMMSLLQQIVSDLTIIENGQIAAQGRSTFEYSFEREFHAFERKHQSINIENQFGLRNILAKIGFYDYLMSNTGQMSHYFHYFQYLYSILLFIDNTDASLVSDELKFIRANYIKSMLSRYELVFLFYYGLTTRGKHFKPLIEKYALLEYLNCNLLPMSKNSSKQKSYKYACSVYNSKNITDYHIYISDFKDIVPSSYKTTAISKQVNVTSNDETNEHVSVRTVYSENLKTHNNETKTEDENVIINDDETIISGDSNKKTRIPRKKKKREKKIEQADKQYINLFSDNSLLNVTDEFNAVFYPRHTILFGSNRQIHSRLFLQFPYTDELFHSIFGEEIDVKLNRRFKDLFPGFPNKKVKPYIIKENAHKSHVARNFLLGLENFIDWKPKLDVNNDLNILSMLLLINGRRGNPDPYKKLHGSNDNAYTNKNRTTQSNALKRQHKKRMK